MAAYALIGTGNVARLHAQAVGRVDGARLVGAWSRSPQRVAAFAAAHGIAGYRSLDELLADKAVDTVAVVAAADVHFEMGLRCLRAGKHVLIEKPVASASAQFDELKAAAAAAGRLCVPIHNYIYDPRLREAKRRLVAGDLGRLSSFWLIYNQKHDAQMRLAPDGLFLELMVHHAYAAIYFGGPPRRVMASGSNVHFADGQAVDQIMAVIEHDGGVISNLWGSMGVDDFTSSPWNVLYKLLGTDGGFQSSWNDCQHGRAELPGWDKPAYRDSFFHVHDYFVSECLAKGRPPLSTLDDGAMACRMTNAMVESVKSGRRIDLG